MSAAQVARHRQLTDFPGEPQQGGDVALANQSKRRHDPYPKKDDAASLRPGCCEPGLSDQPPHRAATICIESTLRRDDQHVPVQGHCRAPKRDLHFPVTIELPRAALDRMELCETPVAGLASILSRIANKKM